MVSVFTTWISKGRYPRPTGWEPAGAAIALGWRFWDGWLGMRLRNDGKRFFPVFFLENLKKSCFFGKSHVFSCFSMIILKHEKTWLFPKKHDFLRFSRKKTGKNRFPSFLSLIPNQPSQNLQPRAMAAPAGSQPVGRGYLPLEIHVVNTLTMVSDAGLTKTLSTPWWKSCR